MNQELDLDNQIPIQVQFNSSQIKMEVTIYLNSTIKEFIDAIITQQDQFDIDQNAQINFLFNNVKWEHNKTFQDLQVVENSLITLEINYILRLQYSAQNYEASQYFSPFKTIADLKAELQRANSYFQRGKLNITHNGEVVDDNKTILENNIGNNATLTIYVEQIGG